jgi:hypothetical protein
MLGPDYYRKQAELFARLALANISDPSVMERYSARALEYLNRADEAEVTGPMPPPALRSRQRRSGDHD